jgi:hypothetical protein
LHGSKVGVLEVRITGVLTIQAFNDLRSQIFRATRDAPAIVARLDTSLDLLFSPPEIDITVYRPHAPSQAVVVGKSQYLLWLQMAENLRAIGVRRAVFPPEDLSMAIQWAEKVAQERLRQSRTDSVGSGPAPLD